MRIPYWDATITLYQRQADENGAVSWKRSVFKNCFWQRKAIRDRTNGAEFGMLSAVCRMPAPYPEVRIGDIIVCGSVEDEIDEYTSGRRSTDLLDKYAGNSMLVSDVHHNVRKITGMDHLYAGG